MTVPGRWWCYLKNWTGRLGPPVSNILGKTVRRFVLSSTCLVFVGCSLKTMYSVPQLSSQNAISSISIEWYSWRPLSPKSTKSEKELLDWNRRAFCRNTWKTLIGSQASLQLKCNKEGFNAVCGSSASRARIGYVGNNENDCSTCDSRIGFGAGGYPDDTNTCGNTAGYGGLDNGRKDIKAMGYILVQWLAAGPGDKNNSHNTRSRNSLRKIETADF